MLILIEQQELSRPLGKLQLQKQLRPGFTGKQLQQKFEEITNRRKNCTFLTWCSLEHFRTANLW